MSHSICYLLVCLFVKFIVSLSSARLISCLLAFLLALFACLFVCSLVSLFGCVALHFVDVKWFDNYCVDLFSCAVDCFCAFCVFGLFVYFFV